MAAAEIVFNSKKAEKFFEAMAKNVKTVVQREKLYAKSISPFIVRDYDEHFQKEAGPKGRWKSWSKIYRERLVKRGKGGNKLLQDTAHLKKSFRPTNYRKDPEGLIWFNPAKTKSGFPYAKAHDEGWHPLPERKFMWLSSRALDKISRVTAAFFTRGL